MKVYFHGGRVEAMEIIICCKGAIMRFLQLHILLFSCFCLQKFSTARGDTITHAQPIADPGSIISSNGAFELGFFSPANTTNRFVGTWYSNISVKTVVWVANRNRPLIDSSGTISISEDGNLVVLNGQKEIIWSSNASISTATSAQLLDSGNLVLQDNSSGKTIWESFQYPSNSFLENMKISSDVNTGEKTLLKSWKSPSDPSIGSFYLGINPLPVPEVFIWKDGSPYWRTGPWNGQIFIGVQDMVSLYLNSFNVVDDKQGTVYLTFTLADESSLMYLMLNYNGTLMQKYWSEEQQGWEVTWLAPATDCEVYGKCGPFGICNSKGLPICSCLKGFEPKHVEEWNSGNFSSGCVRRIQLQCERNSSSSQTSKKDGFLKLTMVKAPALEEWAAALQDDCEAQCLKNCSCTAYAYSSGIGCMLWSGGLLDIQIFSRDGVDLYIRVANSELDKNRDIKIIVIPVIIGSIVIVICGCLLYARMVKQKGRNRVNKLLFKKFLTSLEHSTEIMLDENVSQDKLEELPLFKFEELTIATNNFHETNKLGQGGFGPVYKGKLPDGQEIAVKRLSRSSQQGLQEFMNEVMVISKLQHRNLVRLLGCCVEREEKMLIYEYMPNKSLDAYLFDSQKQELLDWGKRLRIIEGIGRGLLYLHRDSRLRIIHRDLKVSNILLDESLTPKISDFGLARIFGANEDQANTRRVVGTYGYMAPEYAMEGQFSEKSDVFAFGVLLLELVSGRKNTSFYNDEQFSNLLGYAWKLWNEHKAVELIDSGIVSQGSQMEMLRCIHIGLLCVQEFARDRPTMSMVLSMLSNEIAHLPLPKQPAFTQPPVSPQTQSAHQNSEGCSTNECSITIIEAR
ncbi:G-type lectin S-receptor-like serine/threonine-protein kinase At1g11330 isoform X1 [Diospyros lotus]|uniref:G-type lectin S-receptor-like serine/threonine-protein kinase At1g11330 isoform X1 n=2 Tax=Diospyros lotus TaxID=55363 RepID=UPI00224E95EE|nr:G-type lectin S-receptor-like serine/threonine-protein kinase At1g11330 isoform X1 [Diospyros lotus]